MIDVYSWATPNGHKVHIMLEECALPYRAIAVNIGTGDQFAPDFLAISPNNKIPAIVDPDGPDGQPIPVFESGAILMYLAEKTGRFLPAQPRARIEVLQWLMFQMGGVGPMLGQVHHFRLYAPEKIPYAIDRYTNGGDGCTGCWTGGWAATSGSRAVNTPSPTWRSFRGCATGRTRGSRWTTSRMSRRGSSGSRRVRRCSVASRCCSICANPSPTTRRAKCFSGRASTSGADTRA